MNLNLREGAFSSKRQNTPEQDVVGMINPGVELEGKLKADRGAVRLNSHFKGEATVEGTIVVEEQGEVEADLGAKTVTVIGKVKGNIHASERLEIMAKGIVLGDIYTPVLLVEPGGFFDGQCHMPIPEGANATSISSR